MPAFIETILLLVPGAIIALCLDLFLDRCKAQAVVQGTVTEVVRWGLRFRYLIFPLGYVVGLFWYEYHSTYSFGMTLFFLVGCYALAFSMGLLYNRELMEVKTSVAARQKRAKTFKKTPDQDPSLT